MLLLPPLSADDASPRFIGLDLAKSETQLAALDAAGEQIASRRFKTTRDNILALRDELGPQDVVALEVTTNSYVIARLLQSGTARVVLSNPIKTRIIAESKIKTDKIDARVIAELARVGYLPEVWLPDPDTEALRHLFSDRRSLVDRRTELKNTVHAVLHRNLVTYSFADLFGSSGRAWLDELSAGSDPQAPIAPLDGLRLGALLLELDRLEMALNDIESVIAAFIVERPKLRTNLDRLLSIPGVSLVVGAGLLAAIGDITRFKSAKHLASYFGLVPSTYQSGDTKARHGRITKKGRNDARWLAVEAAEHLRKAPGPLRALFCRVHSKRGHNVAVVAVARKLAELVFHLLMKQENYLYEKPHRTIDKRSTVRKMARRKTGRRAASATPRPAGRGALYGSGLQGKTLKNEIARRAAEEAEAIYEAIVAAPGADSRPGVDGDDFDPTRPQQPHWHRVLERFAEVLADEKRAVAERARIARPSSARIKKGDSE